MLFYSYFYGVNAIGDIDNFLICIIIINRVYVCLAPSDQKQSFSLNPGHCPTEDVRCPYTGSALAIDINSTKALSSSEVQL